MEKAVHTHLGANGFGSGTQNLDSKPATFPGASSQRQLRALKALLKGPVHREQLDTVARASNSPETVAQLRKKGLEIPCDRLAVLDADGHFSRPGIYRLSDADRQAVLHWMRGGLRYEH